MIDAGPRPFGGNGTMRGDCAAMLLSTRMSAPGRYHRLHRRPAVVSGEGLFSRTNGIHMKRRPAMLIGIAACGVALGAPPPSIRPEMTLESGLQLTVGPCGSLYECRQIVDEQCGPGQYRLYSLVSVYSVGKSEHSISYACAESGYTVTPTTLETGQVSLHIAPCRQRYECDTIAWINCPYHDFVSKRIYGKDASLTTICRDEPEEFEKNDENDASASEDVDEPSESAKDDEDDASALEEDGAVLED